MLDLNLLAILGQDSLSFHYLLGWPFPAGKVVGQISPWISMCIELYWKTTQVDITATFQHRLQCIKENRTSFGTRFELACCFPPVRVLRTGRASLLQWRCPKDFRTRRWAAEVDMDMPRWQLPSIHRRPHLDPVPKNIKKSEIKFQVAENQIEFHMVHRFWWFFIKSPQSHVSNSAFHQVDAKFWRPSTLVIQTIGPWNEPPMTAPSHSGWRLLRNHLSSKTPTSHGKIDELMVYRSQGTNITYPTKREKEPSSTQKCRLQKGTR